MVDRDKLQRYAELVIRSGCNLQEGQELLLSCGVEDVEFARLLTQVAYEQGAGHVTVRFHDEPISRMHYDNCPVEYFQEYPEWAALLNNSMVRKGAAVLSITSEDPDAFSGVDQAKMVANAVAAHGACGEFYDALDFGRNVWCIVGAATPGWARKVFPDLPLDDAVDALWEAIFKTVRVDQADPLAAWEEHRAGFGTRKEILNSLHLDHLHYTNSLGTDLTIGLPEKHLWQGGGDVTVDGRAFFPNMPTEEIFSTPDRMRAEGTVVAALPLVHNGSLVQDFSLTFKDGAVVDFSAKVGEDVLKGIVETDGNSCRLGECALVPYSSPIRQSGVLFYNTLFDENAACHLALGKGFPDCYQGGVDMDNESLLAAGVNDSATHVDFMIGTADLSIVGVDKQGKETVIFQDGDWAL